MASKWWRAALAAIACAALLPVSPATADQPKCEVTADAVSSRVYGDDPIILRGAAIGCEGQEILAAMRTTTELRIVGQSVVAEDGSFEIRIGALETSRAGFDHKLEAGIFHVGGSDPVTVRRVGNPTVTNVAAKPVGEATNAWGRCDTEVPVPVRAEFRVGDDYRLSRTATSDASGGYVVPLTYASDIPGSWPFRIVCVHPEGARTSTSGSLSRYGEPTVTAPSTAMFQELVHVVVELPHAYPREVRVEALTPSGWQTSQVARGDGTQWAWSAPLTYNIDAPGQTSFRVAIIHNDGRVVRTEPFTLDRRPPVAQRFGTLNTAGAAQIGTNTNVWGRFVGAASPLKVWTEVQVAGQWRTSQVGTTDASGGYVLPNTYSRSQVGSFALRVAALYPDGQIVRSWESSFMRTR